MKQRGNTLGKSRAISMTELYAAKFKAAQFDGRWRDAIGCPQLTGAWIIYGKSANGKTNFAVQLCKYLAGFGKVVYNSIEEGMCLSTQEAFKREGMEEVKHRVQLLDKEPIDNLIVRLRQKRSADIIFIDSLQYTGLNKERYKRMIDSFPNKLFVFVSHAKGKDPKGEVADAVKYDAFVKIWVEGYRAFPESRYGGKKPYTIWDEGAMIYWGEQYETTEP